MDKVDTKGIEYPPEVIEMARRLFLEGLSFDRIAVSVKEATGRPCRGKVIWSWSKKYSWTRIKKKLTGKELIKAQDKAKVEIETTQNQLLAYQKMREKGAFALDSIPISKISPRDATEMIDLGIKGERRIQISAWMRKFLDSVATIIMDEVKDDETLKRIATRFKTELKDYVMKE